MSIVVCPHCGSKNRVDDSRTGQSVAKCGKCGTPLPAVSAGGPVVITDENFSSQVLGAGPIPVLVDCWAAWCPPCRAISPIIDQLANESAGRWKIGKLNVDENRGIAGQFHVDSIPLLLIFKNGKLVDKIVGAAGKPIIEAKLKNHL